MINVLRRADVKRAYIHAATVRRLEMERNTHPRFSRKAIVGACLIPFAFLAVAGMLMTSTVKVAENTGTGNPGNVAPVWIVLFILLPGLATPFVTTILGFISVSQIRHSRGMLTWAWGWRFSMLCSSQPLLLSR